MLLQFWIVLAR